VERFLIDSGPLIALFDSDHQFHHWALSVLQKSSAELITSIVSVHETLEALSFSREAQLDFLTWVEKGALTVAPVTEDDITRLYELTRRPPNYPVDLSDSSLLLLSEKLDITTVITLGKSPSE
jgi:predicted nucleic acid-binding protein